MADNDSEIIDEARGLTNYDSSIFSDSEIQEIVDIGKEEIRDELGDPSFTFYQSGTHTEDRALFWFTCIGLKIRAGEIAGVNMTIGDIEKANPAKAHFDPWLDSFQRKLSKIRTTGGASVKQLSRTNRSYGE